MKQWKKQFIVLWIGQAVSIFTSAVVQMSLIWYITSRTESATMLTLATLVGFLPRALIGAVGGVYIDRHSKKSVMLLADGWIAAVSLVLVIVGEAVDIPLWLIFLTLFGRSVGAAFHEPSLQAATPLIVPKENLTQYAGYAQGFQSISDLLSPAAASILFSLFPLNRIVLLDVLGAAFSMTLLAFLRFPALPKENHASRKKFFPEFKAGLVALRDAKGIAVLMAICAVYAVIYSPIGTMFPLVAISHFGAGVEGSALVETTFAVGTFIGSFLLGFLGRNLKKTRAIAASIALYGLGTLVTGLLPRSGFAVFVVVSVFMGISIPFYHGVRTAILQTSFPPELLGRILSLSMSLMRFAMPIGLILAGAFAEVIGVSTWFALSGALAMLLAALVAFNPALKDSCG